MYVGEMYDFVLCVFFKCRFEYFISFNLIDYKTLLCNSDLVLVDHAQIIVC